MNPVCQSVEQGNEQIVQEFTRWVSLALGRTPGEDVPLPDTEMLSMLSSENFVSVVSRLSALSESGPFSVEHELVEQELRTLCFLVSGHWLD